ncbi:MAG TPA: hypothetical protein VFJ15_08740 [Oleiagrimonas sp.]|nr:hypothetical protein [Oleiagrimonas sp.]
MSARQVRIRELPADHVRFLRALRLIGDMDLKQATQLSSYLRGVSNPVVTAGLQPDVAEHIADALREAGASVVVEDCSIDTPMLCCPPANEKFVWSLFRGILKAD